MRRLAVSFACLLAAALGPAASVSRADPRDGGGLLVYVFSIDALDGDRVDDGQAPFLASLLRDGRATYWRESRAQMIAETNPNHVAMATGAFPGASGIVGNAFATYQTGETDGDACPSGPPDPSRAPARVTGESASCLLAQTFFGAIQADRRARRLTTAGIFGKPKLARIFAGRTGDRYEADHLWTPCLEETPEVPYCRQVPNRVYDEYALFDQTVMDEVLRTVRDGVPGDGRSFGTPDPDAARRPDLTFVNLPGVDNAGHAAGTSSGAYEAAIRTVDGELRRFVEQQRALGLWDRTVLLVVSDHAMDTTLTRSSVSRRLEVAGIARSAYKVVQNGSAALVYLDDRTAPDRHALLASMRAAALAESSDLLAGPPALEALYREPNPVDGGAAHTLAGARPGWRLLGPRTPDLVVTAAAGVAFNDPVNPLAGNHGAPQTRDNFMAVVGGAPLVRRRTIESAAVDPLFDDTLRNPGQSENVDVAPTAMRLLGLGAPAQSRGRFLAEAFAARRLPAVRCAGRRIVRRCGVVALAALGRRLHLRLERPALVRVRAGGRTRGLGRVGAKQVRRVALPRGARRATVVARAAGVPTRVTLRRR